MQKSREKRERDQRLRLGSRARKYLAKFCEISLMSNRDNTLFELLRLSGSEKSFNKSNKCGLIGRSSSIDIRDNF